MRRAIVACIVLAPVAARAGNEDSFLFGDQAVLSAGAVVASSRDTAAIWYNPAGLGDNLRSRIDISATALTLRSRPIPDGLAIDLPSERIAAAISSREVYVVPTALGIAKQLDDGISLGAGLFVTEQDQFSYKRSLDATDATTSLDVAGALTGTLVRYHAGAAIGYRVSPRVRIGASLFGVYEDYREFRKLFASGTMTGPYTSTFLERLVDARASRFGAEALAGVQIDAGGGWHLGATARSPRYVFREYASTDNSTVLVSTGPTVAPVTFSQVDHDPIGAEGTGFTEPARFTAGAAWHGEAIEASGEVAVRLSGRDADAQRTVVNGRAGIVWEATAKTVLGAGLFSDRSGAAPPAAFPDYRVDYYGISAGWKRLSTVQLRGERASTLRFSTTIAVRYALGVGQATRIRFDFSQTATTGLVDRVDDERVDVRDQELSIYIGSGLEF